MEEFIKLLLGYVTKQYNITDEQAAELLYKKSDDGKLDKTKLKDDALKGLLAKDKERVTALKGKEVDETALFDKAYDKALAKVNTKLEKQLVKDYGVEIGDRKLPELLKHVIETKSTSKKGDKELTDDDVKKHPVYLSLEKAKAKEVADLTEGHTKEIDTLKATHAKGETLSGVKKQVATAFTKLKPVLSKDATKAANQVARFSNQFDSYDYEKQTDGSYLVLKDGKRLEDGHGNPITLDKLVSEKAEAEYDFEAQGEKESAGNEGGGGDATKVPTNEAEFTDAIFNATTDEERMKITDAYEASKEGA